MFWGDDSPDTIFLIYFPKNSNTSPMPDPFDPYTYSLGIYF